ncbi:MAG: YHYH protein, partial [Saccharospirillaceae bacterium]|nr:YHYH protein [Pseudomonadales bacterium]NRB78462.1 YHYH protein [Saccharospirillaceae bacterium]
LTVTDNEGLTAKDSLEVLVNPVNAAPSVDVGIDLTVDEQTGVTLLSSAGDSDGSIVTYKWKQIQGTTVLLKNTNTDSATFTTPMLTSVETLIFELTVTDNKGLTSTDSLNVLVNPVNLAPGVILGNDLIVNEQTEVTLSALVVDLDGSIDTYLWEQTLGTDVLLTNKNTVSVSFTSPSLNSSELLSFRLSVTDNEGGSTSVSINVTVNPVFQDNAIPNANAGDDQIVDEQTVVMLSGTATDIDGTISTVLWRQIQGTNVVLQNETTLNASFTSMVLDTPEVLIFSLTVTDNLGSTKQDQLNITVNPTINAGVDQTVDSLAQVTLTGTGGANTEAYTWQQIQGDAVSLSSLYFSEITFDAPEVLTGQMVLIFQLTVTDEDENEWVDTVSIIIEIVETGISFAYPELENIWIINNAIQSTAILNGGNAADANQLSLVNVQTALFDELDYVNVKATGIPDYQITLTQAQVDWLNSRPNATTDFRSGSGTNVIAGDVINFGGDVNYQNTSPDGCAVGNGLGYWPPGPGCPENINKDVNFPIQPVVNTGTMCETGLGSLGTAINGTSIYGWGDGMSLKNNHGNWSADPQGGAFQTLAPNAEVYDVDLCGGHAANGDYHHHFNSACLEEVSQENQTGHSEIYGFAADGFPIYGPYHDTNIRAQSCWVARDYSVASITGCGINGKRVCLLNDKYDIAAGVAANLSMGERGPDIGTNYESASGNTFVAGNGAFFEDYGFDTTCQAQGDEYLDVFNGHDHDALGYHYHISIDEIGEPQFPYMIGPKFKGELPAEKAASACGGVQMGGGGGPPM